MLYYNANILAVDCNQRRPGVIFSKGKGDPKVIDKEYEAFLNDMGESFSKGKNNKYDSIPSISGGIGGNGGISLMTDVKAPLMLTNGSSAPGAASAHARALSNPQTAGGAMAALGTPIFGGKLTRMTAGYKSAAEIEREKEKKKEEFNCRPVPLEWQVERYEKSVSKQHEEYFKQLEKAQLEQKRQKEQSFSCLSALTRPPPPPPGSNSSNLTSDLPVLNGNPWASIQK